MILSDRDGGLGTLFNCASTDAIGAAVRFSGLNTVTTADTSNIDRSQVVGFIITKPTATTCFITSSMYYSAASGFSGFSGTFGNFGSSGYGQPIYLHGSGFSSTPGSSYKVLGGSISPREALLKADPVGSISSISNQTFRNKIINGAMDIWQRGTALNTISSGGEQYWADRFIVFRESDGTIQQGQSTDVPTYAQCGAYVNYSHRLFASTGDASLTGDQRFVFGQRIEGYNCKDLYKGYTFSFWIKASISGVATVWAYDYGAAESYVVPVNVSTSWEQKRVYIPANTSGTKVLTNSSGILVALVTGCSSSSTFSTNLLNQWLSGSKHGWSAGSTNFMASTNNSVWTTLWQVESGPVATPFEFREYSTEISLCQRYFETNYSAGQTPANGTTPSNVAYTGVGTHYVSTTFIVPVFYKVPKRATASLTFYNVSGLTAGQWGYLDTGGAFANVTTFNVASISNDNCFYVINSLSGRATGDSTICVGGWAASAEL